jgi:cytochrome P450
MKTMPQPPGPKFAAPGGALLAFRKNPIAFLMEKARPYGDVVYFKVGPEPFYFLNHPDYIKEVLVNRECDFIKGRGLQIAKTLLGEGLLTSEGEFHLQQRRLIQPSFHRKQIAQYGALMIDYTERMQKKWQDGMETDIAAEMMRLTLAIVAKALFDADVEKDSGDVAESLSIMRDRFDFLLLPFAHLLTPLPLPFNQRAEKAQANLDKIIYNLIEDRRKKKKPHRDLLSVLLSLQDEEGKGMTNKQIRDEAMTLFLAGHETTANALTWTFYLLSNNLKVEEKFHSELQEVLGDKSLKTEDFNNLSYTRKVFTEALRLYPPAWIIIRQPIRDLEIGGFKIPKGSTVVMSPFVIHHDPRYYPHPEKFDPDRWTPEMEAILPRYAFFPFGGGQRLCIGEPMAWMEGILILAGIGKNWKLRHLPNHPVALDPKITLRPKDGMMMRLEKK